MRKVVILLLGTAILLPLVSVVWSQEYLSGSIMDKKGITTRATRIKADCSFLGTYKNKGIVIKFFNLKRIENIGVERKWPMTWRVTNRENEIFIVEGQGPSCGDGIEYYYFNEINRKEENQIISRENIHTAVFGEDIGRMKWNPRTKAYYPPDYLFDPLTGEELIWKNPEY